MRDLHNSHPRSRHALMSARLGSKHLSRGEHVTKSCPRGVLRGSILYCACMQIRGFITFATIAPAWNEESDLALCLIPN